MSLDKINKNNVSGFYVHKNRYLINDINKIIAFYRLSDQGKKEPIDLLRLNFLLSSNNVSFDDILVVKKNIVIVEKYNCGLDVFGYRAVELDLFGNKINLTYDNFIPNISTNKKQFPAIYYRWQLVAEKKIDRGFVDIRYLLGVIQTNHILFKDTFTLFDKENLLPVLN